MAAATHQSFFIRRAHDGIVAACEALFPDNNLGAPDWKSTEMVRRMWEYLDELPAEQRRLLIALFVTVELGCIVLAPGLRRFSRATPLQRAAIVRRWRRSRLLMFRVLGDALKATTTVIYLSHPSTIAHIGAYKACDRPGDSLPFRLEPNALQALDQR